MRRLWGFFVICLLSGVAGAAVDGALVRAAKNSLLTAQTFPKTFSDLSFVERMAVEQDGFEDWESEFDASGRCIRGCAYVGITIEDDLERMRRNTELAEKDLERRKKAMGISSIETGTPGSTASTTPVNAGTSTAQQPSTPTQTPAQGQSTDTSTGKSTCSPRQTAIPEGQKLPLGSPLAVKAPITSGYGERVDPITGKRSTHKGVDFSVPEGTDVFTPADGKVTDVSKGRLNGNWIKISHDGSYETLYLHLSEQFVKKGEKVQAGCRIGKSGNTGRSTGPHLHYTIWHNGKAIDPKRFLGD